MKQFTIILLLLCFAVAGCGNKVTVSGKVIFSDDRSPVPNGTICFDSGSFVARGQIQPDGTYIMGSLSEKDGMPNGEYKVYFLGMEAVAGFHPTESGHEPDPMYRSFVAQKFLSASTSGLTAKIDGKTTNLDFQVDRAPDFPKDKLP